MKDSIRDYMFTNNGPNYFNFFFSFCLTMLILSDNENKAASGPLAGNRALMLVVLNLPKPLVENSHHS